ncbi:hypothetical protein, partial [Paracoccus sp. (in: a-proteobacteria)]|uniref:hypothetical protein n=1 Tax=Paracoccus sp. TaxID=267 RepID=UPI0033425514
SFTGEARRKPPCTLTPEFMSKISGLRNHDLAGVDSFAESRESTIGSHLGQNPASGSHPFRSVMGRPKPSLITNISHLSDPH